MIMEAYSVFDEKAGTFGNPFFQSNELVAKRMFVDLANDPQSMVHRHPSDFKLYRIGKFDTEKGSMEPAEVPEFLCNAPLHRSPQDEQNTDPIPFQPSPQG